MDAIFPPSCLALGSGPDRQSVLLWVARSVPCADWWRIPCQKEKPQYDRWPPGLSVRSFFSRFGLWFSSPSPFCFFFLCSLFRSVHFQALFFSSFFYIFYIVFKIPSCAGVALQCWECSCGDVWCISWRNLHSRRISLHSMSIPTLSIRTTNNFFSCIHYDAISAAVDS